MTIGQTNPIDRDDRMARDITDLRRRIADLSRSPSRTWTALTLSNSWVAYGGGYTAPQYRRVGDEVQVRGLLNGTSASAAGIATLPAGFRPAGAEVFSVWVSDTSGAVRTATRVDVTAAGVITLDASGPSSPTISIPLDFLSLAGIRFSVL